MSVLRLLVMIILLFAGGAASLWVDPANAQAAIPAPVANPADGKAAFGILNAFLDQVREAYHRAYDRGRPLERISNNFFIVFSIILLLIQLTLFVFKGSDVLNLLQTVLLILIVKLLMANYDFLTSTMYAFAEDFAKEIQFALVATDDQFFVGEFLQKAYSSLKFGNQSILRISLAKVVGDTTVFLLSTTILVAGFFASAWGTWGYALSKMIGYVVLPTLLLPRLQFLFDGWFRLFFGFIFYAIIARLTLCMTALLAASYFGVTATASVAVNQNFLADTGKGLLGLFGITFVGIAGLIGTGKVATTIAGGIGGSGIGAVIQQGINTSVRAAALVAK